MKRADHTHGSWPSGLLLIGLLVACTAESPDAPVGAVASALTCDFTPYLSGVSVTDLNKNPVAALSPNTSYLIKACGKVSSMCISLTGGGQLSSGAMSCRDTSYPSPYTPGDVGFTLHGVTTDSSAGSLTGTVTPWDSCAGAQPQFNLDFSLPGSNSCGETVRDYVCGYARPGNNCDNWRISTRPTVTSMAAAVAACQTHPPDLYTDFCYVLDRTGATQSDISQCATAGGSWRPGNSCCNFRGSLSCP